MRGKFKNYGELGITQISEAVELAKVLLHRMRKLRMDVEFMEERDFNQRSEDGYDEATHRLDEFNDVLACFAGLRSDLGETDYIEVGELSFDVKQLYNDDGYDCTQVLCGDDEESVIRALPELLERCIVVAQSDVIKADIPELRSILDRMRIKWDCNELDEVV